MSISPLTKYFRWVKISFLLILSPNCCSSQRRLSVQADGLFQGAVLRKYTSYFGDLSNFSTDLIAASMGFKCLKRLGIVSGSLAYRGSSLKGCVSIAATKSATIPSRSTNKIFFNIILFFRIIVLTF